jgi:hypothetical protein
MSRIVSPEPDEPTPLNPIFEPLPEDSLIYEPLRTIVHSMRVLGYMPFVLWSLLRHPRRTVGLASAYYFLRNTSTTWNESVRRFVALGSSSKPRLVRAQSKPYDKSKQYLLAAHPHGILNFGWWNLIARFGLDLVDGIKLVFCMAPAVQYYPLYGEIFGDRAKDPSAETIRKVLRTTSFSPAILPGGFSEAVYTNAHPTIEYNYIADRMGFVRLAIEHKIDIIPAYSFGLNDMYVTFARWRQWRAIKAQAWGLPMVFWTGPMGGWIMNNPFTEAVTVVTFDPFPASSYTLDQVEQAHKDYLVYLERCFESRKAQCGAAHKTIEFIGRKGPRPPGSNLLTRAKL